MKIVLNVLGALAFISGGILAAELVIMPAVYWLVGMLRGPEYRAHKRELEERARRHKAAYLKAKEKRQALEAEREAKEAERIRLFLDAERKKLREEMRGR